LQGLPAPVGGATCPYAACWAWQPDGCGRSDDQAPRPCPPHRSTDVLQLRRGGARAGGAPRAWKAANP